MKPNNSDNLDDFLKERLENFSQEPPKRAWKNIREQLNATNRAPWTSYAEGFALVCLMAAGIYWLYNQAPGNKGTLQSNIATPTEQAPPIRKNSALKTGETQAALTPETASKMVTAQTKGNSVALSESAAASPSSSTSAKSVPALRKETASVNSVNAKQQSPKDVSQNGITAVTKNRKANPKRSPSEITTNTSAADLKDGSSGAKESAVAAAMNPVPKETNSSSDLFETVPPLESLSVNLAESPEQKFEISKTDFGYENHFPVNGNKDFERSKTSEFHIGMSYTLNNPWIINENTYGEFYGTRMRYKVNFGSAYGFHAGYDYKQKFCVQMECNLRSFEGQKFEDGLWLGLVRKDVELHYLSFPLIFKYKIVLKEKENYKVTFSYMAGAQYESLRFAELTINDRSIDVKDRFRKGDFAGIIGMETSLHFMRNFAFTLGSRTSLSSDINAADYPVINEKPGLFYHYSKTHNLLLGLNASLNYYFGK